MEQAIRIEGKLAKAQRRVHAALSSEDRRIRTLGDLARLTHYSGRHLRRTISRCARLTPLEVIRRIRCRAEVEAILRSPCKTSVALAESGLPSEPTMRRDLKRVLGITMTDLRKDNRYDRASGEFIGPHIGRLNEMARWSPPPRRGTLRTGGWKLWCRNERR